MLPRTAWLLPLAAAALVACGRQSPRNIAFGAEPCAHCHMAIADPRFAAEAITPTGKVVVFDDVGCLAAWLVADGGDAGGWVMSFVDGEAWLPADSSVFLRSDALRTPMGSGLAALRPGGEADSVHRSLGGELLSWAQVLARRHPHGADPS